MPELREHIDIMTVGQPRPSRWDRGDGAGAIAALDGALARAGLPGRLEAPKRLLARADALEAAARYAKQAAARQLEDANRGLLTGSVDLASYGAVLRDAGTWLDADGRVSPGMGGVMQAAAQVRGNATATTFAMATGLYGELQAVCREVVAECAAVPQLPREIWSATSTGQASTLAIRAGREADWAQLVRVGDRFDQVHAAGQLLRETGTLQGQLMFTGPTAVCVQFLNWEPAQDGLAEVNRLPGPLRVRAAVDKGWMPGLFLKADHDAFAVEPKPRRRLLAGLAGR
jgi:hypothetical protein